MTPQPRLNNPNNVDILVLMTIIFCGIVLYFIPLHSTSFYFDDHFSIENNEAIRSIDIPRIFNAFNTRFLVGLSFALNYKWCALNPAGYRFINLLIHCLNAFLVYLLVKVTLRMKNNVWWPAFFASMLFLCHPIQTEPVNFITQRFVLMGTLFYLLTLFLYIQYRCRSQKRYLCAGMLTATLAMFCKEFVITLPLMIVLYDFYFLDALAESWWKRCSRILPFFMIALIVPLLLLRTPSQAIGVANIANSSTIQNDDSLKVAKHIDITRARKSFGREQYFLTEVNVLCTYVRLLFFPIHQNLDYDYPLAHGIDNKTVLCGVFLICLLVLAGLTFKSHRIISFSILWFFIALSVESSFIPIGHVIAEYRLYLASVGFVLLATSLIYSTQSGQGRINVMAAAILLVLCILTYQRNAIWRDEFSLWDDVVHKSPHKARGYNNRGLAWYNQGKLNQAMADYNQALAIDPHYVEAYCNRGFYYESQGDLSQAILEYSKAIEVKPNTAQAYNNRATVYYRLGQYEKAWADVHQVEKWGMSVNPKFIDILKKASGKDG